MGSRDLSPQRAARSFIIAIVTLLAPGLNAAEPVVDGPRTRFDDPFIATLEGRWDIVRQIRGTEVRNTMTAAWVLNHQFLRLHMKDVKEPPAYEAIRRNRPCAWPPSRSPRPRS
jgi:hypothetical protein